MATRAEIDAGLDSGNVDKADLKQFFKEGVTDAFTDVASAATVDLGAVDSFNLRITGTTTITSFGTAPAGTPRTIRFAAALALTHNATSLILPGGANIATVAGDVCQAVSLGAGNWLVTGYASATAAGYRSIFGAAALASPNTFGGNQTIAKASPAFALSKAASGEANAIFGQTNGVLRWAVLPGSTAAESGANAGSSFDIGRYSDAGTFIDLPLSINRATGVVLFSQRPSLAGTGLGVNLSATTTMSLTAVDITGIPSNARRVTIILDGVSTNGTSDVLVQLGDAGGVETSGYLTVHAAINTSTASGATRTTGWSFDTTAAGNTLSGALTLHLADAATFTWVGHGVAANTDAVSVSQCAGRKSLSAVLDRIRITTVGGTDAFDAGSVTVAWEA